MKDFLKSKKTVSLSMIVAAVATVLLVVEFLLLSLNKLNAGLYKGLFIAAVALYTVSAALLLLNCFLNEGRSKRMLLFRVTLYTYLAYLGFVTALFFLKEGTAAADCIHALACGSMVAYAGALMLSLLDCRFVYAVPAAFAVFSVLAYFCNGTVLYIAILAVAAALIVIALLRAKNNFDLALWAIFTGLMLVMLGVMMLLNRGALNHIMLHIDVLVTLAFASSAYFVLQQLPKDEAPADESVTRSAAEAPEEEAAPEEAAPEETAEEAPAEAPIERSFPAEAEEAQPKAKWTGYVCKKYQNLTPAELMDAPLDALKGISKADAELMKEAFNIKTIGEFANNKFFNWADEIVEEAK